MTTVRYGTRAVELPIVVEGNTAKVVRGTTGDIAVGKGSRASLPSTSSAVGAATNKPRYKSKTEARYAQYLDALKFAGEVRDWWYEPFNFKLPGKKNFHRIDFLLWFPDGHVEIHQTKGWHKNLREGMTKAKTAAGLHPWAIHRLVTWDKGQWQYKRMEA